MKAPARTRERTWLVGAAISIAVGLAACSSDPSSSGEGSDGGAASGVDGAAGASRVDGAGVGAVDRDAASDLADAPVAIDASGPCGAYCACMASSCPDKVFTGGCLGACAAETKWDLACRTAHCSVAKGEPNNGHCDHAVGVSECLDHS